MVTGSPHNWRAESRAAFERARVGASADGDGFGAFARRFVVYALQSLNQKTVFGIEQRALVVDLFIAHARLIENVQNRLQGQGGRVSDIRAYA